MVNTENKKMRNVSVNLYENNQLISTKTWTKKFNYKLDLEKYYTLEMKKEGFIVKKIAISTFEGDKGCEPFMFVLELIKEEDAVEGIDIDFPSALIEYKKNQGRFNFNSKYAKNRRKEARAAANK